MPLGSGVVDIPNPECTSVARAFIRKKPNSKCTEADLVQFVADRLPEHKQLHVTSEPVIFKSPLERDPSNLPECPIFDFLLKRIKDHGVDKTNRPWMVDTTTGAKVYFKDIETDSKRVASALTRLGFGHRDFLYFATYETAVLYLVQLGVWRLGGGVRGGFQTETPEEFARQLRETQARFILVDKETFPVIKKTIQLLTWEVKLISFDDVGEADVALVKSLLEDDGTAMPEKVDIKPKDDVICAPNTSASTGLPKGVCHTHFSLTSLAFDPEAIDVFGLSLMSPASNYAIGSYIITCCSISYGTTVFQLGKFQKENFLDLLTEHRPANTLMYPFVCNWLARCDELDQYDLSFLESITITGAVLDATTIELMAKRLPHVEIIQLYGMTELINVTNARIRAPGNRLSKEKTIMRENQGEMCVSSGKLVPYVEARVVDVDTGEFQGPNKRGEICVKSPMTMKGYLREGCNEPVMDDLTDDGYYKTGDIGFFDEDSNIYVVERTKFLFKYQAWSVSPTEIESVIKQHPGVLEVGVIDVPDLANSNVAKAFVRKKPNATCTAEELIKFVADRLIERKQLHGGVVFVDKLPESKGNKLDRIALKKLAKGGK
ncbi:Hypothetical predicted protein [Cloeon dipterum]|uniref:AMP-dependent synthetase/ligase domain-containing protein n=1 Tax=Cloeon dipterum TaxID=197152 RepID=A0A8S1CBB4_9INSE|nr:Hypothetical predicted protein [Cloeon dipterum]